MKSIKLAIISVISTATLLASVGVASAATTNSCNGQTTQKSGSAFTQMKNKAGRAGLGNSMSSVMSVVAQDLNVSADTLKTDLKSGKSINDIAEAQGVDTSKLASDVQAALTTNINQAVQDGKITSDQASKMEANLAQRIQKMFSQTWHSHTKNNGNSQNADVSNS